MGKKSATKKAEPSATARRAKVTMPRRPRASLAAAAKGELSGKDYAREMKKLHVELVKMQEWVKLQGLKVCIVFKGRDGAGKRGTDQGKKRVRLNVITHLLKQVPYKAVPAPKVGLPKRMTRSDKAPRIPFKHVPEAV